MSHIETDQRLSDYLDQVIQDDPCSLEAYVAQIILDHVQPETYLSDILNHGCACGCVPELIYYSDTHRFYDRFYDEIEEIRENWESETGEIISIKGDLKNFFAWFAFEQVAWWTRPLKLESTFSF